MTPLDTPLDIPDGDALAELLRPHATDVTVHRHGGRPVCVVAELRQDQELTNPPNGLPVDGRWWPDLHVPAERMLDAVRALASSSEPPAVTITKVYSEVNAFTGGSIAFYLWPWDDDLDEPVSDGTMPCPMPSPSGQPCSKRIPKGWTARDGHGGGHFWASPQVQAIFDGGHYDASAALAGLPFEGHLPADCRPGCPNWAADE